MGQRKAAEDAPGLELRVARIPSASLGGDLVTAKADESLANAQTTMLRHGFSQLPVNGAGRGDVISWRSIALASLLGMPARVEDCLERADTCSIDDGLLTLIPRIVERDYVLVTSEDGALCGIVTAADIAREFNSLAGPFLVVGQCEQELRELVRERISVDALRPFAPRWARDDLDPVQHMSLGEIEKALHKSTNWQRLDITLSQDELLEWLASVRELRNQIAHFRADEEGSARQLEEAENLATLLRTLRSM